MKERTTIMIVEDEPALLLGLASTIKRRGYEVITAANGADCLQKIDKIVPDLVLSDVMMPPPNGFELRRILSSMPGLASIPFIFLTARSSVEDRILGLKDGADDYITKPFETEELFARIEAVLRRVQVEQERGREAMKVIAQRDMEKLKQEIIQNFHHELRTPLTNVLLPLELAANNRFDSPEEQSHFIRVALSNADKLESLVTDLILLSNIDGGNLNTIRQVIDAQVNIILPIQKRFERYQAKGMNLVIECPPDAVLYAPRREFTQALVHLADNAFKFSPQDGNVTIRVTPGQAGGASIYVWNDGPAIPANLREKVFERFYQVSQGDDRQYDGLGVGLTIARSVFEHLGGSVQIMDVTRGCAVHAVLPDRRLDDVVYG